MTTKKSSQTKNSAMTPEQITTNPADVTKFFNQELSPEEQNKFDDFLDSHLLEPEPIIAAIESSEPEETDPDPGGFIDEARRDDILDQRSTEIEWPLAQDQNGRFIDLDNESREVINSHQYVKNGIPLPKCNDFLEPIMMDLFNSDLTDVRITVRGSKPVEVGQEGELLKSYARVSLVYEICDNEEFHMSIGFVYALDQANPIIKVFSGVKVTACTNLCIFGANDIEKYNILSNRAGAYEKFREYIRTAREKYISYKILINYLKSNAIAFGDLHRFYGTLCQRFTATKNISGTNVILNSFQLIQSEKSEYFVRPDGSCSLWNLYNSMTDDYRGKTDLLDQPEKVLSLFRECESFIKNNDDLILTPQLN